MSEENTTTANTEAFQERVRRLQEIIAKSYGYELPAAYLSPRQPPTPHAKIPFETYSCS